MVQLATPSPRARNARSPRPPAAGSSPTQPPRDVSDSIRIARVLCIFFMIYVHVNPGVSRFAPDAEGIRLFDVARFWLVDSLGRASVALLSVIAGYLAVYSLRRDSVRRFASKKVTSLMTPLLLWDALFIAAAIAGNFISQGHLQDSLRGPLTLQRLPNLLIAVTASPANEPLDFLRDVFVCSMLAPLLIVTLRRSRNGYIVLVVALAALGFTTNFLHTPNILLLYALGIYVAQLETLPGLSAGVVSVSWVAMAALGLILAMGEIETTLHGAGSHANTLLEIGFSAIRLPAAVAFWDLSLRINRSRVLSRLARLEPFVFIAFCCHLLVTTVVWLFWQRILGGYYAPAYPLFFFLVPVFVMIAAVVLSEAANRYARPVFAMLNGGRSLSTASFLNQRTIEAVRTRALRRQPRVAT
ncbi:MAG TPA: acyltransferase [Dehalococcoidia bacterium]|nr:acyltransferase [Dehalococcoidia bacterium]